MHRHAQASSPVPALPEVTGYRTVDKQPLGPRVLLQHKEQMHQILRSLLAVIFDDL